jgi:ribonuclease P protein component
LPFNEDFSLPFSRRLRGKAEFEKLLKGRYTANQWLAVYKRENRLEISRLGMIVSKRLLPRAVQRNRVKRMIRESFRHQFSGIGGMDIVVRLRRPLYRETLPEGRAALDQLLDTLAK